MSGPSPGADLTAFGAWLESRGMAPGTVRLYVADVRRFLAWVGDDGRAVTPLDVAEYRRQLQETHLASTVNRVLRALRAWGRWLVVTGQAESSPAHQVRMLPEPAPQPRALSRSELSRLLRAVTRWGSARDRLIVVLFALTGLRVGELVRLRRRDIDLGPRSGWVTVRSGKGGRSRRVPLPLAARRELAAWLERLPPDPDGWLLPGRRPGSHLSTRAIEHLFARLARLSGLAGLTPHVLRHTYCTQLLAAGVSLDRVALLAGHSRLDVTARYTRATEADLAADAERIDWA